MIDDEKQYRKNNSSEEYKNTFEKGYDHNCKCLEIIDYIHSLKKS